MNCNLSLFSLALLAAAPAFAQGQPTDPVKPDLAYTAAGIRAADAATGAVGSEAMLEATIAVGAILGAVVGIVASDSRQQDTGTTTTTTR